HARFADPTSDFLSILNLWNHLREQQKELGSSAFRRLCRSEHLNYVRVREWFDVHRQLRTLVPKKGSSLNDPVSADPDAVHKALLAGLLSQIGILDERNLTKGPSTKGGQKDPKRRIAEYRGARGIRFSLFPGSALRKKAPRAVMAAEIVETSRTFARTAAAIDPAWAEALAGDLAKRQISEPHWSKESGAAVAFEKVTLFGVEIVARRRVQFARIDRPAARELFLRHALVEGEWDPSRIDKRVSAFWRSNAELRRRLEKLEERERRRDILVGDEAVFRFYDERIPNDVFDVRSFEAWWRDALTETPKLLVMREGDLLDDADRADQQDFPTRWTQADQVLGLAYRFEPGAADDGVSVVIPLALLQQVRDTGFDWQVPGLRAELVTALLRALPKAIRRHVVPAADWADTFGAELAAEGPESHQGLPSRSLREALARLIQPLANQPMSAADFDMERVSAHLRMNFRAVDERGRVVGSGRDLTVLQSELADRSRASVARSIERGPEPARAGRGRGAAAVAAAASPAPALAQRDGITAWDLGELPEVLDTRVAGGVVRGYPALVDQGKSVALQVEATAEAALAATRDGVLRLVLLGIPSPASYVQQHLTSPEKLALAASPYPTVAALIEDAR
ncbi:MAG: ATP-dependent helicase, partial [Microbacterium sp. 14-71-5]